MNKNNFKEITPYKYWEMPLKFSELQELQKYNENIVLEIVHGKFIEKITIETPNGDMIAEDDDWILLGVNNELYPAKTLFIKIN